MPQIQGRLSVQASYGSGDKHIYAAAVPAGFPASHILQPLATAAPYNIPPPEFPQSRIPSFQPPHLQLKSYRVNGQVKEAVELLRHMVAIHEKTLAEDHPDRLALQHALAGAYQANGQVRGAVELLEHVVGIQEKTLVKDKRMKLKTQKGLMR